MGIKSFNNLDKDLWSIKIDADDDIEIMALCCLHVGSKHHDRELFLKYLNWLQESENRYIMSIGDLGDYSIPTHMPYTMWEQSSSPAEQIDEIISLLKPVQDKIIGLVDGNHELRIWKKTSLNPTKIIANELGVPNMGINAYINLHINDELHYDTFWIHGSRGGLPETALRYAFYSGRASDTDFFVMGHSHFFATREFTRYVFRYGKQVLKRTTGVRTASYLIDPPYAKSKMYDLCYKGSSIIKVGSKNKTWSVDNSGEFKFE